MLAEGCTKVASGTDKCLTLVYVDDVLLCMVVDSRTTWSGVGIDCGFEYGDILSGLR